jgi:hypothetical protein
VEQQILLPEDEVTFVLGMDVLDLHLSGSKPDLDHGLTRSTESNVVWHLVLINHETTDSLAEAKMSWIIVFYGVGTQALLFSYP